MSKQIEGFYVDPESGTFQWVNSLLEEYLKETTAAIFREGTSQSRTDELRGRRQIIDLLKKKLSEASR